MYRSSFIDLGAGTPETDLTIVAGVIRDRLRGVDRIRVPGDALRRLKL
jgi:hypothetical protein